MAKKRSRLFMTLGAAAAIAVALGAAFWPRPMMVDIGEVVRAPMMVAIQEEGRTRVHDAYVVSTPVAGLLLRVQMQPGDAVDANDTVVARMRPTNPAALDVRTREQARAAVTAAQASLRVAQADLNAAIADYDLAKTDLDRTSQLAKSGTASQAALDRANRAERAASARLDTAKAAIAVREAEVQNANALLIGFDDQGLAAAIGPEIGDEIPLFSPVDGRILRIMQQSETTLPVGAPIMEIGDIESDLEVVVSLLSTDAVQVTAGDPVIIDDWGGQNALMGRVERVDPFGVTKYSALGVEEQRVSAVIAFEGSAEERASLGHGYRVEARIIVWQNDDAQIIPSNALFRNGDKWSTFVVSNGTANIQHVDIGQNNGVEAELLTDLGEGTKIVLYPSASLIDGSSVAQRHVE